MAQKTKVAFGERANIEAAKQNGAIDEFDLLLLKNGEVAWIDKEKNTVFNTPRTQEDIVVNGVTGFGIANGETIPAGITMDDLVRMLVQKAIPATYTKPTITLSNNGGAYNSGNVEAGTSVDPKLLASFVKNDAGDMTSIEITMDGEVVGSGTASPLEYNGHDVLIGDNTVVFKATAEYGDAPVKRDNLGAESKENWFEGGSVSSGEFKYTGKRKLFYGTGVGELPEITSDMVRGLNNSYLAPYQGYSFNVNVAVGQQYIVIAYPDSLRDISSIMYVEQNDPAMADQFVKSTANVADARGGSNGMTGYKVFTYEMMIPAKGAMTFKVTI